MRRVLATSGLTVALLAAPALAGPHDIYGTRHADVIHGNQESDAGTHGNPSQHIYALQGDDVVYGGKGRDYVYGGAGADKLNAFHASRGLLNGGPGKDTCIVGRGSHVDLRSCETVVRKPKQGDGGS